MEEEEAEEQRRNPPPDNPCTTVHNHDPNSAKAKEV
jgi:hypothetical protein